MNSGLSIYRLMLVLFRNTVSTENSKGPENRISIPSGNRDFFPYPQNRVWGQSHSAKSRMVTGAFLRGLGTALTPSSVEVKNAWSYTSTPVYIFMVWCQTKRRNFSL